VATSSLCCAIGGSWPRCRSRPTSPALASPPPQIVNTTPPPALAPEKAVTGTVPPPLGLRRCHRCRRRHLVIQDRFRSRLRCRRSFRPRRCRRSRRRLRPSQSSSRGCAWSLHVEMVDGRSVVTATVNRKHEFKIVCQSIDLQTVAGLHEGARQGADHGRRPQCHLRSADAALER